MSKKIKVAFQGEKGAYSHLACFQVFPDAEVRACSTFEDTFRFAIAADISVRLIRVRLSSAIILLRWIFI